MFFERCLCTYPHHGLSSDDIVGVVRIERRDKRQIELSGMEQTAQFDVGAATTLISTLPWLTPKLLKILGKMPEIVFGATENDRTF